MSVVGSVAVITGGIESIGGQNRVRDGNLSCTMPILPVVTGLVCLVSV